ncbi:1307_t:CDS:2 [Entrophospora sp. SA101]|nr:1307_t:CDS:2 [Entrophospora sp. SA101]
MKDGEKRKATQIVYQAAEIIEKKTATSFLTILEGAVSQVKPALETRSRRIGGGVYRMPVKLAEEINNAYQGTGEAFKKKENIRKEAEANLQIVCPADLVDKIKQINFDSNLIVSGKLVVTSQRQQPCELQVSQIEFINPTATDYPLQKKNIPLEVVRKFPHLRAKTNYFLAIFRLRHSISKAIHDFFHQAGFYYVPTPIITSNDTEGAGELFNVTTNEQELFFSKPAKLTVSGQLQAEALVQGLGKVYTFAPCFRAEKSHTTRHLAEF